VELQPIRRDTVRIHIASTIIAALAFVACATDAPGPSTASTSQAVAGRTCGVEDDGNGHYTGCFVTDADGLTWRLEGPNNGHGGITQATCELCGLAVADDMCATYTICEGTGGGGGGGGGGAGGGGNSCGNGCFQDSASTCHCGGILK
jgi:hypothetical protein